ncbi:MAG: hypothetical protein ABSC19_16310 [Syntrophorhabdales bacterium]|jgi:chromosome segregation ATPase
MKGAVKRYLLLVPAVLLGLALGLGYGHVQTQNLKKADQARIKEINQRLTQSQRRYAQGMAERSSLEDGMQAIQAETEKVRQEKERLLAENKGLTTRAALLASSIASLEKKNALSEAKSASLESKNGQLTGSMAKTEADHHALEQKERHTFQTLQEREKELKALNRKYDQCAEHNARLYVIGDELIKRYQNKGVVTTLLEKEPVTQIKRVELEKLARDYKEKIDQQKIKGKGESDKGSEK